MAQAAQQAWSALEGRPWVRVGTDVMARAAGATAVVETLKQEITRRNLQITLSETGTLGLCFADPVVDIKLPGGPRVLYKNVTQELARQLVERVLVGGKHVPELALATLGEGSVSGIPRLEDQPYWKLQTRVALRLAGTVEPANLQHYIANGGYRGLAKVLSGMTPKDVLDEVGKSGLRGRGGAAFPTSTKWSFLSGARDPVRYVLVNCEEGDPGAFNDKGILECTPFTLLEGTTICGFATGAAHAYVFIRHGNWGPIDNTRAAVLEARKAGLLGKNILGSNFSFDIDVALTGESYVSGEETALMEAIEGKRSMPRSRPPFPAQVGLWGKPSNINNVKTLSYAPEIMRNGGDWFASIGFERSKGTAIACMSGSVQRPGLYEVPFGLRLRDLVEGVAGGPPPGHQVKLLQTGGPLGGVLDAKSLDVTLDYEAMGRAGAIFGSGGIIVGDERVCAVDLTRNLVAFCQFESCGKCFPCRLGMTNLLEIVDRIARFEGEERDLDLMRSLGQTMQAGSLCGHGQLGFNPISSAIRFFERDFMTHIRDKRCPTGSCNGPFFKPSRTRPAVTDTWYVKPQTQIPTPSPTGRG
jgi:NADH-quinone oxidoreductase subunit F